LFKSLIFGTLGSYFEEALKIMFQRFIILLALVTSLCGAAVAGPLCGLGSWNGGGQNAPANPMASQQMGQVNQVLCNRFGCPYYQFLQSSGTENAMALSDATGNYIVYNSSFMNSILQSFGPKATIGILGHELGHLIDFNINRGQVSRAGREATADRYAGCAFALAGEPESELIYLARTLQSLGASPGYPTPDQRVSLLRVGYNQCR